MKIVNTDNYGGDYPDEKFVNLPTMDEESCKKVCDIVNDYCDPPGSNDATRFYKTVPNDYELAPGFEP